MDCWGFWIIPLAVFRSGMATGSLGFPSAQARSGAGWMFRAMPIFVPMEFSYAILSADAAAKTVLEAHLTQIPGSTHFLSFTKPGAALYQDARSDLLLLDMDGQTLTDEEVEGLSEQYRHWIVLSSHREQAAFAYDCGAVDFVPKPVHSVRLDQAIRRVLLVQGLRRPPPPAMKSPEVRRDYFFVKSDYKVVKIAIGEIQYIEGLREYVRIHTDQGRIVTLATLSRLEEILPVEHFARVHRSFIVNLQKIHFVQGNVISIGNKQVAISKSRREEFLELLNQDGLF
ncbi:MAG: hypothetical protein RLZZ165_1313 [Bacteroidota bacterium]|jgi:DNA-binding LytR/AlgR family response regulator